MALAIFVRSIPVALGIGIVWSGPLEHLTQDAWTAAGDWFPGLLLEALAAGGTDEVSLRPGPRRSSPSTFVAVAAAAVVFARRDVTS